MISRCVLDKKTLTATFSMEALSLADVVVVDVQCDFLKEELGNVKSGNAEIQALEESFKVIGQKITPNTLVLIETTVPPGTTEYIAYPFIKKAFEERGGASQKILCWPTALNGSCPERDTWPRSGIFGGSAERHQCPRPGNGWFAFLYRGHQSGKISADGLRSSHGERNLQDR